MYQYWRHNRSGETFAVRIEAGRVTGACGPLHYGEVIEDLLPEMHYDDMPETSDTIDSHRADYALVELPRTRRLDIRVTDREFERLHGEAQRSGVSVSTLVRRRALA
jgi:hypothetical protein